MRLCDRLTGRDCVVVLGLVIDESDLMIRLHRKLLSNSPISIRSTSFSLSRTHDIYALVTIASFVVTGVETINIACLQENPFPSCRQIDRYPRLSQLPCQIPVVSLLPSCIPCATLPITSFWSLYYRVLDVSCIP